jgi:hypothetical protein
MAWPVLASVSQPVLAQVGGALGWSLVLIVFLIACFAAVSYLKKWLKTDDEPVKTGFTLSDLREIHRRGEITDEEYERARSKMVASAKSATANMPDPAGGRRAPGAVGPFDGNNATGKTRRDATGEGPAHH